MRFPDAPRSTTVTSHGFAMWSDATSVLVFPYFLFYGNVDFVCAKKKLARRVWNQLNTASGFFHPC